MPKRNKSKLLSTNKYVPYIMKLAAENATISEAIQDYIDDPDIKWEDILAKLVIDLGNQNKTMKEALNKSNIKFKLKTKYTVCEIEQ